MGRLLFWIVLVVAAVVAWRMMNAKSLPPGPRRPGPRGPEGEAMIPCARCGTHLPRSDAVERDGQLYCSEEHARLGVAPPR